MKPSESQTTCGALESTSFDVYSDLGLTRAGFRMNISEGPFSIVDGTGKLSISEPVEGDKVVMWIVKDENDFARPRT